MKIASCLRPLLPLVVALSCAHAQQSILNNTDFELGNNGLPKGWGLAVYVDDKQSPDWRTEGSVTMKEEDGLVVEQQLKNTLVTFYQPAGNFQAGQKYRLKLTYDAAAFEGKILLMLDGGSSGVNVNATLPEATGTGFVTNEVELAVPADATADMLRQTSFQLRLKGQGTVKLKGLEIEAE